MARSRATDRTGSRRRYRSQVCHPRSATLPPPPTELAALQSPTCPFMIRISKCREEDIRHVKGEWVR
ncbi:hypothetical protein J6590_043605 [Homalodisca vitripennis]|nr:hypothetical protein J6590_043605 [Homalodisca vitripennis]